MQVKWAYVLALCCSQVAASSPCPPPGYSQQALNQLKARSFALSDDDQLDTLALALVPCLAATDPAMRDGIAFDALSTFMRSKQLRPATAVALMDQLVPWLDIRHPDPQGVARPFAALVLSEIVRMDRIDPFLSSTQRNKLLSAGTDYLVGVRDYRGFDETVGWRHGVAHGADLMLQLTLNTQVQSADLRHVLDAIAPQIAIQPSKANAPHFYVYGESQRLARPVFYAAQRQVLSAEAWRGWVRDVASPSPFANWREAVSTQAGLARRHNLVAFLNALYVLVQESDDAQAKSMLLPLIAEALK